MAGGLKLKIFDEHLDIIAVRKREGSGKIIFHWSQRKSVLEQRSTFQWHRKRISFSICFKEVV